jgi:hypothetical protein
MHQESDTKVNLQMPKKGVLMHGGTTTGGMLPQNILRIRYLRLAKNAFAIQYSIDRYPSPTRQ